MSPSLGAAELLGPLVDAPDLPEVEVRDLRRAASVEVTLEDLVEVARVARDARREGTVGLVVTQGTDTLEEAAFALELLGAGPVVVTGAMRHPGSLGADGPANLAAALRVAAHPATRDLGALVVMNDEVHAARFVRKTHTASPAAFASPVAGPLGDVVEGRVRLRTRVSALAPIDARPPFPPVPLVTVALDDDGLALGALGALGVGGLVVEAPGGGHVPARHVPVLADLARRVPVVLASRTGSGPVLGATYGYPGGEVDLLGRGLVAAGSLDARHARVALLLLLSAGADRDAVAAWFAAVDQPAPDPSLRYH